VIAAALVALVVLGADFQRPRASLIDGARIDAGVEHEPVESAKHVSVADRAREIDGGIALQQSFRELRMQDIAKRNADISTGSWGEIHTRCLGQPTAKMHFEWRRNVHVLFDGYDPAHIQSRREAAILNLASEYWYVVGLEMIDARLSCINVGPLLAFREFAEERIRGQRRIKGSLHKADADASYYNPNTGYYESAKGPLGHVPLGVKILLIPPLFAGGFWMSRRGWYTDWNVSRL
jgi:hypothetical protein